LWALLPRFLVSFVAYIAPFHVSNLGACGVGRHPASSLLFHDVLTQEKANRSRVSPCGDQMLRKCELWAATKEPADRLHSFQSQLLGVLLVYIRCEFVVSVFDQTLKSRDEKVHYGTIRERDEVCRTFRPAVVPLHPRNPQQQSTTGQA